MLFKNRIRNKANKMFDDLIVDPSFIKHNSPKNKTPFINVLAPALSAAVCVLLIGGVTTSLILIGKNNYLATFWHIFLTQKVRPRYSSTIHNHAITILKGIFHTLTHYIVRTINKSGEKHRAKHNRSHKTNQTQNVFYNRVFLEEFRFHTNNYNTEKVLRFSV